MCKIVYVNAPYQNFQLFYDSATGHRYWVDAPEKEIIFLNDLRYEMHGENSYAVEYVFEFTRRSVPVNIIMPKKYFSKDCQKQPIFYTADTPIIRIRNGALDVTKTE